jgi:hypothetical protein
MAKAKAIVFRDACKLTPHDGTLIGRMAWIKAIASRCDGIIERIKAKIGPRIDAELKMDNDKQSIVRVGRRIIKCSRRDQLRPDYQGILKKVLVENKVISEIGLDINFKDYLDKLRTSNPEYFPESHSYSAELLGMEDKLAATLQYMGTVKAAA